MNQRRRGRGGRNFLTRTSTIMNMNGLSQSQSNSQVNSRLNSARQTPRGGLRNAHSSHKINEFFTSSQQRRVDTPANPSKINLESTRIYDELRQQSLANKQANIQKPKVHQQSPVKQPQEQFKMPEIKRNIPSMQSTNLAKTRMQAFKTNLLQNGTKPGQSYVAGKSSVSQKRVNQLLQSSVPGGKSSVRQPQVLRHSSPQKGGNLNAIRKPSPIKKTKFDKVEDLF